MNFEVGNIPYHLLGEIADEIFSRCEDNDECLANALSNLEIPIRTALLSSDLLNAWQVFYYYFREYPGDDAWEILTFTPAGSLRDGVSIGESGLFILSFLVDHDRPEIVVADDIQVFGTFSGKSAWRDACRFMEEYG